ncbi:hypothetical protein TNCV_3766751 [Trichonephila clavipes]|nr:hypothetical protein TNCV_3766751 [Trichonephila clavipes]
MFNGKNLSAGHFDAYVFVSSNNGGEVLGSNIQVARKQKQINPKMPLKRKRSGLGNCARTRKMSNCLQMMQVRISETAEDREERFECQREMSHALQRMTSWKDIENAAYSYNSSMDYKSDAELS